jgi:hypothetical protein
MIGGPEGPKKPENIEQYPAGEVTARNLITLADDSQRFVDAFKEEIARFVQEAEASGDEVVKKDAREHLQVLKDLEDRIVEARDVTEEFPGMVGDPKRKEELDASIQGAQMTYRTLEEAYRRARELISPIEGDA